MSDIQKEYIEVKGSSYTVVGSFAFLGTGTDTPTKFVVTGSREDSSGVVYCRIWDGTNGKEIAILSFTPKSKATYETTSFSNLPAALATFEFQVRETGSTARIHSMGLL